MSNSVPICQKISSPTVIMVNMNNQYLIRMKKYLPAAIVGAFVVLVAGTFTLHLAPQSIPVGAANIYVIKNGKVYHVNLSPQRSEYEMTDADAATFVSLGNDWGKDAKHIFDVGYTVTPESSSTPAIDLPTFGISPILKDKNAAYTVDFKYQTDGSGKGGYVYSVLEGVDPNTYVMTDNPSYAKDKSNVYYLGGHGVFKRVEGADPATFKILGECAGPKGNNVSYYATDAHHVIAVDHVVEGADPATFKIIKTFGGEWLVDESILVSTYAADKNQQYGDCGTVLNDTTLAQGPVTEELLAKFFISDPTFDLWRGDFSHYLQWEDKEGYTLSLFPDESIMIAKAVTQPTEADIPNTFFSKELQIAHEVFIRRGFTFSKLNSSTSTARFSPFYDYIQAYEKGDDRCSVVVNSEDMSYLGSGTKMGYTLTVTCSNNLAYAEMEQRPILDVLGYRNSGMMVNILRQKDDFFEINIRAWRGGMIAILKREKTGYRVLIKTQAYPPCELIDREKIPVEVLVGIGDGQCEKSS